MKFSVLTLFPSQVKDFLYQSIIGRACEKGLIEIDAVDIRDFTDDSRYRKVDDTLYGGGTGMLMQCGPVYDSWRSTFEKDEDRPYTIYVSPKGSVFDQEKAISLSKMSHIAIICGHYEGIDARVTDEIVDEEISIGDYVLTGGEPAACVMIDSISRMIPGVLPNSEAFTNESHMNGTLEAPQYTKPPKWHDKDVPEVLMSGDKARSDEYNRIASLVETWEKRPDMIDRLQLSEEDWTKMLAFKNTL